MLVKVEELKNEQKFADVKEQLNVIIRETKGKKQFKIYSAWSYIHASNIIT